MLILALLHSHAVLFPF